MNPNGGQEELEEVQMELKRREDQVSFLAINYRNIKITDSSFINNFFWYDYGGFASRVLQYLLGSILQGTYLGSAIKESIKIKTSNKSVHKVVLGGRGQITLENLTT